MKQCPCGSFLPEESCCLPIVRRETFAPTSLALMRSRYSAYVWGKAEYVFDTYASEWKEMQDRQMWLNSYKDIDWEGLEIVTVFQGGQNDEYGEVEFFAHYRIDEQAFSLHEHSFFKKEEGLWVYVGAKE